MTDRSGHKLEICVDSPAGVAAAIAGGADRIELCSSLAVGGLTPGAGLADWAIAACNEAGVAVRAMVRPRGGDFAYDRDELAVAIAEGRALLARGVHGLVFGAARDDTLDTLAATRWIGAMHDAAGCAVPCTFHRAIDLIGDPVAAVIPIAKLGFACILTSGGSVTAPEGAPTIRAMIDRAGDAITIMPGSGVTPATIAPLIAATGAVEWHASASGIAPAPPERLVELGFSANAPRITDVAIVRSLRQALDSLIPTVQMD